MFRRKPDSLLVCLIFIAMLCAANAHAWTAVQAAFVGSEPQMAAAPPPGQTPEVAGQKKPITKVKPPQTIVKVRPPETWVTALRPTLDFMPDCVLPITRPTGWEMSADAMFARTRGKARLVRGLYGGYYGMAGYTDDVDFNSDLGIPEHAVIPSFAISYRFQPQWSVRYSIMPFSLEGTTQPSRAFTFGTTNLNWGVSVKGKWERLYQRIGLAYDPIRTPGSRLSVFGDYVRINERLSVVQIGCCGDALDNDLNMGMAGIEFEKCLKTTRSSGTLSLECKAGVAFADEAFGSDLSSGLKYSIPLNNGRWGFVKGGYRYVTYKKKYSDLKMMDTAMDGGFLQMGIVF
jgi:hypothetical protein